MLNNLRYDYNTKDGDRDIKNNKDLEGFTTTDYVESFQENRAYKCFAARNIYFS